MKKRNEKGKFTRGTVFQVILYLTLALSFLMSVFCIYAVIWLTETGAYNCSYTDYMQTRWDSITPGHYSYLLHDLNEYGTLEEIKAGCMAESEGSNVTFDIVRQRDGQLIWSNRKEGGEENPELVSGLVFRRGEYWDRTLGTYVEESYCLNVHVDTSFPAADELKYIFINLSNAYDMRYYFLAGAVAGVLLWLISFIWILCNAGHRKAQEGIVPGVLSDVYLDVLTGFWAVISIGMLGILIVLWEWNRDDTWELAFFLVWDLEILWWTAWLREFALRLKLGKWWRHSLCYVVCRALWRNLRRLFEMSVKFIRYLPTVWLVTAGVSFIICGEFLGICYLRRHWDLLIACWFVEKLVLTPVVLYCAMAFQKLLKESRALAEGNLSGRVNMRYLILGFKQHGENLNRIGEGMSRAVEQRLQSEMLKTELITNVSHDLKTPLTSIINYSDLLGNATSDMGAEQIKEYSEVLLRQSARLKKLLDDLVEVSKANTGNLEVTLIPCELGVLLTQVAGEYEEKLGEKKLELHVVKPEEEIRILADGRHLWRVFDNLMNNICKYAQEGSRVYLNMEKKGGQAEVIFRNMSKYELNVSPQELTERFVRGDSSRHMEGSGLGLSIAGSLVELQKGEMEILTDGDLFKVILRFPVLEEGKG